MRAYDDPDPVIKTIVSFGGAVFLVKVEADTADALRVYLEEMWIETLGELCHGRRGKRSCH